MNSGYFLTFFKIGDYIITYDTFFYRAFLLRLEDFRILHPNLTGDRGSACISASKARQTKERRMKLDSVSSFFSYIRSPILVGVSLTRKCNLSCTYCYADKRDDGRLFSFHDFESNVLQQYGLMCVKITGGEPCLSASFIEFIKICSRYDIIVTLDTNGALIQKYLKNDENIQALRDRHVNVQVSIDSVNPEINDILRGHTYDVLRALKELRHQKIRTRINTVLTSRNIACLNQLADFLIEQGIENWTLIRLKQLNSKSGALAVPVDAEVEAVSALCNEFGDKMRIDFNQNKRSGSLIMINPEGNYYLPENLKYKLGNIHETPLHEIWNHMSKRSHILRYVDYY